MVSMYKHLGVVLTPTLRWTQHAQHLVQRGNRLFAQCVSWCRSERLPLAMASSIFMVYVLPSVSWGTEFFSHSPPALRQWTTHSVGGVVSCWAGLQARPVLACWQNLVGPTLKDCRQAGCSLSQLVHVHFLVARGVRSLELSSSLLQVSQEVGPTTHKNCAFLLVQSCPTCVV